MILAALIVATVFALVYSGMRRSHRVGMAAYFIQVLTAWHLPAGLALATVAGFSVTLADITAITSFILFAANGPRIHKRLGLKVTFFYLFCGSVAISIARGSFIFGFGQAINESRLVIYFLGAIAWVCYFQATSAPGFSTKLISFFRWASGAILALELLNIATHGLGSASESILIDSSTYQTQRPLVAIQAMFLLCALTLEVSNKNIQQQGSLQKFTWLSLLTLGILLAQQRSVWIAFAITILLFMFFPATRRVGVLITAAVLSFWIIWGVSGQNSHGLTASFADSLSNTTTFFARTGSWAQYLENFRSMTALDIAIGQPFGSGWGRYDGVNNLWVDFNPHNWYLIVLLRTGIIGFAVLLAFYIASLASARFSGKNLKGLATIQAQQMVFQIFYPSPWQVPLLSPYSAENLIPKAK